MDVVVVGGGVAGLAAAVHAADQGHTVTLLESRSFCGGRAYSFRDPASGQLLDNGQHLLMGCYTATCAFLERIGTRHLIDLQDRLDVTFVDANGRLSALACPRLPRPWHLLAGLWRHPHFPRRDLWHLVWGLRGLRHMNGATYDALDELSIAQWLAQLGQGEEAIRHLWEPLVLAVMNETPARASAAPFVAILREGVMTKGVPRGLGFPRVGLSPLLIDPACAFLAKRGATIRTATAAQSVLRDGDRLIGIRTRRGEDIVGDSYILALPPRELHRLMTASGCGEDAPWSRLAEWESVPILSVHLWYDRPILPRAMVGLTQGPFHWAFDKTALVEQSAADNAKSHVVALVSSACREGAQWSREEILHHATQTMQQAFPQVGGATLLHSQVTKEVHATVSVARGSRHARLPTRTPFTNTFLAGDWTQTQLPATIEGAIRSGVAAANAVSPSLPRRPPLRQPLGKGGPTGGGGET
jgi:hydroxysqualene dehydroxylase